MLTTEAVLVALVLQVQLEIYVTDQVLSLKK